jgi:hypothetical protein
MTAELVTLDLEDDAGAVLAENGDPLLLESSPDPWAVVSDTMQVGHGRPHWED